MKLSKLAGATGEIWQIFIRDASSTTGAGLTGLAHNTAGLSAYYHRDTDTTATEIALVTMTVGTFTSAGFKEIDAAAMPGWYQFCPPNAALAAGAKSCGIHLMGATNMAPMPIEAQLTAVNPDSAGSYITGVNGVAQSADNDTKLTDIQARLPAALTANGNMKSSLVEILTTALTETAGQIAAAFKQFFDVAAPTGTMKAISTVTNLTNAPTNGDLTATMKASVTAAATAATPTAAAVTGAVGSVTGLTASDVAAIKAKTDNLPSQPAAIGDIPAASAVADAVGTRQIIESYRANGSAPTLDQALCEAIQHLGEASIIGTTKTIKKFDHSTTAETFTLNDADAPTGITRAT